ncbi:RNA polymerase sigma factor SigJ [Luteolibacter ambystomatis]|uniref:RNA polymerase sigma factor SigJ n=1 Tax=Luteolibacter ambystomatis TaxID=2824561 RepID=A0A975J0X3_9BACT|nr:RNA polymerase sigma factor SigJ [Luteolibacter ambystomatis]QUE51959.1 RNA polymerase sigma factor SigJ [Luteolibacter ambystomatis]
MSDPTATAVCVFEEHRPFLRSLAYRMLGTLSDAEDVVQDAWLRWADAGNETVESPKSYLAKIVTRLCLDHMKSARVRRETYIGEWLPEPLPDDAWSAVPAGETGADVGYAVLHAMERLSPLERAAFLLHDVFGESFAQVADFLEKPEAACRQLASRARTHLKEETPRFQVAEEEGRRLSMAFLNAARGGDLAALKKLLRPDAVLYSDGGPVRAARRRINGHDKIARMYESLTRRKALPDEVREVVMNGLPGYAYFSGGRATDVLLLGIEDGVVRALYIVRNPEKLERVSLS